MIAKGHYIKGGTVNHASAASHLSSHLKYLEHRSRERDESREERTIFSKEEESVSRREALDDVMDHTSQRVSYHQIVLSPAEDEPVQDWREWTREAMADLEAFQGTELHWYAVHHSNTDHEHVHVVLAGAGEDLETGQPTPVTLSPEDYRELRESGQEHSEFAFYYHLEVALQEYDRQDEIGQALAGHDQEYEHGRLSWAIDEGEHTL